MKTTETSAVSRDESKSRLGFYLGIGLAGAAGLGLGMTGKTAWQRLSTNLAQPATLAPGNMDTAKNLARSEPNPADKSILQEAFVEAFGPPAGLPAGLAQAATELPAPETPSITLAQAQLPARETVLAANPGIRPKTQDCLPPLALSPMLVRHVGPDGLERIGIDFDLSIPRADLQPGCQTIQQAGFFVPSGEGTSSDGKQSGGGAGGMAKVGPSSPMGMDKGTLGSQEPEPLIGSFTTDFEDGYLKLPEELAGWVVEGKVFIAPGPDGGLRMAPLEDLETMFNHENDPHANRADGGDIAARESAPSIQSLRRNMRRFYGLMTACIPEEDEEGGLWIPLGDQLAKQAGLKGEAVIVGMRTHAEIWSKEGWEAELATPKTPAPPKQLELQKVESRSKVASPGK